MSFDPRKAWGSQRQGTTPYHMWYASVLEIARVSEADARQYVGRERLQRWFDAGESAEMAADSLRTWVKLAKKEARSPGGEVDELRRVLRRSVRR